MAGSQATMAPRISLAAVALLLIVFSIVGQGDMPASDPIWYGNIAHDPAAVFAGTETHPFVMRIGLTMPLALFYQLFGVSPWTTNLPCLLAALGIVAVVYAAAPTPRAKLIGMVLCATSIPLLRGLQLNIDLPCAALMAASVLCLSRRWLVLAMVAWFAAFLVKETALWCAPVWIYAFVIGERKKFVPALAVGAVLGVIYLWICARVWGSPFARFHGIQELTYEHTWSLHGKSAGAWAARLGWQVPWLLVKLFFVTVLALPLAPRFVRPEHRIWIVATLTFTLLYWFGSSSLSAYSPLPISQRMVLPVLPGFLVLGALVGDAVIDKLRRWWPVAAVAVVVPGLIEMGTSIYRGHPEADAFAIVKSEPRPLVLVCGEPRCVPIANFYFGFEVPSNVTVVFARDFAAGPEPHGTVRALVNTTRAAGARTTGQDMTGTIDAMKLPVLYRSRHVRLYDGNGLWTALVRQSDAPSEIRPDTDKPHE